MILEFPSNFTRISIENGKLELLVLLRIESQSGRCQGFSALSYNFGWVVYRSLKAGEVTMILIYSRLILEDMIFDTMIIN